MGDAARSSVGLTVDRVHIRSSLTLRGKCSFLHVDSFVAVRKERHAVTRCLWSEEVKTAEIHRRTLLHYGASFLAKEKSACWLGGGIYSEMEEGMNNALAGHGERLSTEMLQTLKN